MGGGGSYKPDFTGTGQLMRSAEMLEVMKAVAERGISIARVLSAGHVVTGEYESSFTATARSRRGGVRGDRAEAWLVNTSGHAARVEWQDDLHILARTAGYLESRPGG